VDDFADAHCQPYYAGCVKGMNLALARSRQTHPRQAFGERNMSELAYRAHHVFRTSL